MRNHTLDPQMLIRPDISQSLTPIDDSGRVLVAEGEQEAHSGAEQDGHKGGEEAKGTFGDDGDAYLELAEGDDDIQPVRKLGNPKLPSADEIDDHCKTHLPYRCWCKHCQQGRGVATQHYTTNQQSDIPRVGLDYFYLTKGGITTLKEISGNPSEMIELDMQRREGQAVKCLSVSYTHLTLPTRCLV